MYVRPVEPQIDINNRLDPFLDAVARTVHNSAMEPRWVPNEQERRWRLSLGQRGYDIHAE